MDKLLQLLSTNSGFTTGEIATMLGEPEDYIKAQIKEYENIKKAAVLSMYSGADFIKTSTGKIYDGATVEAAYVMCQCKG